jgi:serine/threonine protein kinase KIN1/2
MLVANSTKRAQLSEVLSHPWMQRGFPKPPELHVSHREPLRADELDMNVIAEMKKFEFGSKDNIELKLIQVLESDSYIHAVQAWKLKRDIAGNDHGPQPGKGESVSDSSAFLVDNNNKPSSPTSPTVEQTYRRFFKVKFYRHKVLSIASCLLLSGKFWPGSQSRRTSVSIADPTRGFHPLLSMYYLAQEKLEREPSSGQILATN